MTTKTVINTNMPSTRGISILIDQDQTKHAQQQQSQTINSQQQTLRSSQKTENGKITIYQNTTTTTTQMAPTPSTAITRTVVTKLQPQPSKLVATTTTRIGVNDSNNLIKNNDDEHVNNDDKSNERTYDEPKQTHLVCGEFVNEQLKTGYSTIKQTITTTTAVPTFPHLLLKVASERGKTVYEQNGTQITNEEMREASGNEARFVGVEMDNGKLQPNRYNDDGAAGVAANINRQNGQSSTSNNNNNSNNNTSSTHTNPMSSTSNEAQIKTTSNGQIHQHRMMIIQCNGNDDKFNYNKHEESNDELTNNDERVGNSHHHVGSPLVVTAPTKITTATATASNVDHDESSSGVTSVVAAAGNGQNAFERICTNDQNGSKNDRSRCHETIKTHCTADDQQQLESKDVNANTNTNANVANNNSSIAKKTTTVITTPIEAANCASAVTERDIVREHCVEQNSEIINKQNQNQLEANETKLHVLKIQIKPQEVNEPNDKKQVTVVNLNELQEDQNLPQVQQEQQISNLKQTTIPVNKIERKAIAESARPATSSESANNLLLLHTINGKMVQKPTTTTTVKTTMAPTTATMASTTTILNSGAIRVTGGGGGHTTTSTITNKKVNAYGNANGSGNSNGNSNGNANCNGNTNGNINSNGNSNGHANHHNNTLTSGNTSVTELNVSSHPSSSYLYYVMSSGQFSPCDTLDSGTGSDMESNGNITPGAPSAQSKLQSTLEKLNAAATQSCSSSSTQNGVTPKMELLLKGTKIRLNGSSNAKKSTLDVAKNSPKKSHTTTTNDDHARAGSFTDSEESEASSLSCDSLHSNEFIRQSSVSPTTPKSITDNGVSTSRIKMLGSFLPDSLLRDIRDRKFPTNDFEVKYGNGSGGGGDGSVGSADGGSDADADGDANSTITNPLPDAINEEDYINVEHAKFLCERNSNNIGVNNNSHNNSKRLSLPNKTFVFNAENGTFVDTKMNSMPRKYEADKYYNFHVKEHENFRSFDISGAANFGGSDLESLSEYETKSLQDDAFAGYKDIRCGSATSTIRSSKGTVRGVKNRVRNGIATFLQLQQPNMKNFKEKDAGKVVLYTTSMGIIRDTYAKCANVKQILRTLLVKFEERDVFMSIEYQQEIKERMHSEAIKVPQLFVEGQHIGDADTVERLNESGELRQLLKPYKSIATTFTCQTCGGYRLLPCPSCNGSKKSVHRNHFTAEFVALKCMNCDEVGLVKCHNC